MLAEGYLCGVDFHLQECARAGRTKKSPAEAGPQTGVTRKHTQRGVTPRSHNAQSRARRS